MNGFSALRTFLPSLRQAAVVLLICAVLIWAGWSTQKLIELQQRRIVTVQLGRLMEDFVTSEARVQRSPQEAQARVVLYLEGVQAVIDGLAKDGTTVLVGEAVISGSAPDYSNHVRTQVDIWMKNHGPR